MVYLEFQSKSVLNIHTTFKGGTFSGIDSINCSFQTGFRLFFITRVFTCCTNNIIIISWWQSILINILLLCHPSKRVIIMTKSRRRRQMTYLMSQRKHHIWVTAHHIPHSQVCAFFNIDLDQTNKLNHPYLHPHKI